MYSTQSILKIENSAQEIIPSILPNFTTKLSITTLIGHFVLMISLGLNHQKLENKAGDGFNKWLNQNLNINQV